jgi:16S rRNA (cytosine1402-N4)-methyltransferase
MVSEFSHAPVMVAEVLELYAPVPDGLLVDTTVGGAGHAAALLAVRPGLRLLGLDRDPDAVRAATAVLESFGPRAAVQRRAFAELDDAVAELGGGLPVVGVLFDLGVSSHQLDTPERGFSYRVDGPLDMRMDPTSGRRALDLVNEAPVEELRQLFAENGERRLAGRLARAIAADRPLSSTAELAAVVDRAVPLAGRRRGHPARRVFQALRLAVNDELDQLATALPVALALVAPAGRVAVLSYHSGEDQLVKRVFADAARGGCQCPPGLPCVCGARPEHRLVTRGARRPSPAEVEANHRSASARLRAIERLASPGSR